MDYRNWDYQLAVGARIAVTGYHRTYFGTIVELGKSRSRYVDRPGFIKVRWDEGTHESVPTKFNSRGDAWGSSGLSRFGYRLANAEQAAENESHQRKEKAKRDRMRWLRGKVDTLIMSGHDVETVATELRLLADLLEGDFVDGEPA